MCQIYYLIFFFLRWKFYFVIHEKRIKITFSVRYASPPSRDYFLSPAHTHESIVLYTHVMHKVAQFIIIIFYSDGNFFIHSNIFFFSFFLCTYIECTKRVKYNPPAVLCLCVLLTFAVNKNEKKKDAEEYNASFFFAYYVYMYTLWQREDVEFRVLLSLYI